MKDTLLNLEMSFFYKKYINDINWLNKTIHDEFLEMGKSGFFFDKETTIRELLKCKEDRNITIHNFTYKKIDVNTYLVHYITKNNDTCYYRTSIWIDEHGLQLFFHQASLINENIPLI